MKQPAQQLVFKFVIAVLIVCIGLVGYLGYALVSERANNVDSVKTLPVSSDTLHDTDHLREDAEIDTTEIDISYDEKMNILQSLSATEVAVTGSSSPVDQITETQSEGEVSGEGEGGLVAVEAVQTSSTTATTTEEQVVINFVIESSVEAEGDVVDDSYTVFEASASDDVSDVDLSANDKLQILDNL